MAGTNTTDAICKKCDKMLGADTRICSCGCPTPLASFKERSAWEVQQWRRSRSVTV